MLRRTRSQAALVHGVRNWHKASIRCGAKVRTRSERSGHAESVGRVDPTKMTLNRQKHEDFAAMHRRPHRPMMC